MWRKNSVPRRELQDRDNSDDLTLAIFVWMVMNYIENKPMIVIPAKIAVFQAINNNDMS